MCKLLTIICECFFIPLFLVLYNFAGKIQAMTKKHLKMGAEMLGLYIFQIFLYTISGDEVYYVWLAFQTVTIILFIDWSRRKIG